MAIVSLGTIKGWFKTKDKPTQAQFYSTWDSFWHKLESIPVSAVNGLQYMIAGKAETGDLLNEMQVREAADMSLQTSIDSQSVKVRGDWDASGGTFPAGTEQDPIRNGYTYRVSGLPTNEKVKFGIDLDAPIQWARAFSQTHIAIGNVGNELIVYKSTDGGISWNKVTITLQPVFNGDTARVVIQSESEYYCVSEIWNQSSMAWHTVVSRSSNGGITWTTTIDQLPDHDSSSSTLLAVNTELDTNLLLSYYVQDTSRIYRVYSQGSVMTPLSYIADGCAVQRIECRESELHYALVQRYSSTRIYKSTDNCLNWQLQSTVNETGASIAFIDNTSAYLITRESNVLRKSTDSLVDWSNVSVIDASFAGKNKVFNCFGAAIVVVCGGKIVRSDDSGVSWNTVLSNITSVNTFVIYSSDQHTIFICCGRYDWQHGFLYRITDLVIAVPYMIMQNGDYIQYSTQADAVAQTTVADWFYYDTVNRDLRIDDFDASAIAETINETVPSQRKLPTEKAVVDAISAKISSLQGMIKLIGSWNADTNVPDISTETVAGHAYIVAVAGASNLGGETDWKLKDWAVKIASGWIKIDNSEVPMLWGQLGGDIASQSDVMPRDLTILPSLTGDLAETNSIAVKVGTVTCNATIGKLVGLFSSLFARVDRNNTFNVDSDAYWTRTANGSYYDMLRLNRTGGAKLNDRLESDVQASTPNGTYNVFRRIVNLTSDANNTNAPIDYSVQTTQKNSSVCQERYGINDDGLFFVASGGIRYTFPIGVGGAVGSSILRLNAAGTALEWVNLYAAWDAVQTVAFGVAVDYSVANGTTVVITLTGNAILNMPTNLAPGMKIRIIVKQDATGGRLLSFATGYKFPGAIVPSWSSTSNSIDIIEFLAESNTVLHCVNFISDSK